MIDEPHEIVKAYCSAWNERDDQVRRQLLEKSWADDGTYSDPGTNLLGREALLQHIRSRQEKRPGAQIVMTSGTDKHHQYVRFGWKLVSPAGEALVEGIDFGELASDGRLNKIVGFFGPLPDGSA